MWNRLEWRPASSFAVQHYLPYMSIRPPHISPEDRPIRRKVALAYRSTREAGRSHHDAMAVAMTAYFEERPDEYSNPTAASERVAAMICSAISLDPEWFWQSVRRGDYWPRG